MSKPLTIKDIAEDLSLAEEVGSEFGYRLAADGQSILAESYTDDGMVDQTYKLAIDIQEDN